MPQSLGLDISTQSCSAIIIDSDSGAIVAECSVNFGEDLPQYNAPNGYIPDGKDGEVHSDPRMWLDALDKCLEILKGKCDLSSIAAISGAGQQHGTVYLNSSWEKVLPLLSSGNSLSEQLDSCFSRDTSPIWMDTSTSAECAEIADAVGPDAVCSKSGSIAVERFSGPQIRRFYKKNKQAYGDTIRIHLVSSFFASILSGRDAPIDHGDGAGMNLLNLESGDWDDDLLNATAPDLRNKLPASKPASSESGKIASYFVEKYGFKENTAIITFTGDNPSSLVGMGASRPGRIVISLGTSDTFFAGMPKPLTDPNGFGHVFGNPCGGFMTLQCFLNGSLAREKIKDQYKMSWDEFGQEAFDKTPPGNNGNLMLPFFGPEITPRLTLDKPSLSGSDDFCEWKDANAAARACVEGQMINMFIHSRWMNLETNEILLTGGASQSPGIAQTAADVFQATVKRLAVTGSVALGAALRAAVTALGADLSKLEASFCKTEEGLDVSPKAENAETYAKLAVQFKELIAKAK